MQLKVTSTRHASIHVRPFFNHSARTLACLLARSLAVLFLFSCFLGCFRFLFCSWLVLFYHGLCCFRSLVRSRSHSLVGVLFVVCLLSCLCASLLRASVAGTARCVRPLLFVRTALHMHMSQESFKTNAMIHTRTYLDIHTYK